MKPCNTLVYVLALICGVAQGSEQTIVGTFVRAKDGDTFVMLDADNVQHTIRLKGVDTPEKKQPFAIEAKRALERRLSGKSITVKWKSVSWQKRKVGDVFDGEDWINLKLVEEGLAWQDRRYSKSTLIRDAQRKATGEGRGLWSEADPVPPWEFRSSRKSAH